MTKTRMIKVGDNIFIPNELFKELNDNGIMQKVLDALIDKNQ